MEFTFYGWCTLTLDYQPGAEGSKHISTDFNLEFPEKSILSVEGYIDENGHPTAEGSKVLTEIFLQGLIGNIHIAHKKGFRDDVEHLMYIISKLEQGFATPAEVNFR